MIINYDRQTFIVQATEEDYKRERERERKRERERERKRERERERWN